MSMTASGVFPSVWVSFGLCNERKLVRDSAWLSFRVSSEQRCKVEQTSAQGADCCGRCQ